VSPILLPLESVKALLGITDTDQDDALTAALPVITAYFENHCRRGLAYVDPVVEESRIVAVERLPLYRFPVYEVAELAIDGTAVDPVPVPPSLDQARGFIYLSCGWGYGTWWWYPGSFARVTYSGGYPEDDMPADLALAFARCCADFGGVTYSGSSSSGGGAPLKSLGLGSGALTVSFDTQQAAKSSYDTSTVPPLLAPYLYTLEAYRVKDYV
jgi:hypothetical protein